jgi:hypothetical protein
MVARDRARARKMPHNVAREAAFYSRKITVGKCLIQAADDIGVGRRWHGRSVPCHPAYRRRHARRREAPIGARSCHVADVTTTGYAAESAHDRAGLMALVEETWCMLNGMTIGSDGLLNFDLSGDEREFLREA